MGDSRNSSLSCRRRSMWRASGVCGFLFLLTAILPQASATLANETAVLLNVKQAWGNPVQLNSWSTIFPTCTWVYVRCDSQNSTVLGLSITGANVNSSLPVSIADLVNLEELTVQGWGLIGQIPRSIGSLRNLTSINLSSNNLSGVIPPAVGNLTKVTYLDLSVNSLSGVLPLELSQLRQLTTLNLGTNQLSGTLPSWIGSFPELSILRLGVTNFEGSIPPDLGNLTKLQILNIYSSGLRGVLPPALGKLTALTEMELYNNQLTGAIPDSYANIKSLTILDLYDNFLNSSIPSWLGNITNLTSIDLSSNTLIGSIPDELGNLALLQRIDLHQNRLSGLIPTQFSRLRSLTFLDLHDNRLSGPIPTQFSQLLSLSYLDLSDNFLDGSIPPSLTSLLNLALLELQDNCLNGTIPTYNTSNSNLLFDFGLGNNSNCFNATQICKCAAPPPLTPTPSLSPATTAGGEKSSSNTAQNIYIAVGVVAGSLIAISALLFAFLRHKCFRPKFSLTADSAYRGSVQKYTLAEVIAATDNYTTKVGEGAFATVYRAVFKDGTVAAVKRFDKKIPVKSFEKEVDLFARLKHRFLVNVVGYCEEAGEHMLMFEFMDRGNLHQNLHDKSSSEPLTWDERVKILIHVAYGIEYLHYGTDPPIIHRDIKSANILLSSSGSSLAVKVADFGLGKQTVVDPDALEVAFGNEPPKSSPTTQIAGTPGYYDPAYVHTSVLSAKSDIFSYGVVLLELITGRKAIVDGLSLADWYLDQEDLWSVVDPKLQRDTFPEEQLVAVAELARHCIEPETSNRPTIREVLDYIKNVFRVEARIVDPSLAPASAASSNAPSRELNSTLDLTSNMYTQSEILPRD